MKKIILSLAALAALSSAAFAHHMSPSDNAGGNMSSDSGHLVYSLPALLY
jgi:uncharacterized GH25 family protein